METGWLVESKHPTTKRPQWLGLVEGFGGEMRYSWRDDSSEAIRFCRMEDARRFGKLYRDRGGLRNEKFDVTEHVWVDGVPANVEHNRRPQGVRVDGWVGPFTEKEHG